MGDNYIEIIINASEEDIEIEPKGDILFSRQYMDAALLSDGIIIRRL